VRRTKSLPLVGAMKTWLEVALGRVPPRGGLTDAIRYALTRWSALCPFLDDGRVELDTPQIMYNDIAVQGSLWFPRRAAGEMIAMIAAETLDLSSIQPETVDLDHVNDGVCAAAKESMGLSHWAVCPRQG